MTITTPNPLQGSVPAGPVTATPIALTLDDAIQMGLKHNLGLILQSESASSSGGTQLQQLQNLLPTITGSGQVSVQQINLRAQGLNFPTLPEVVGPFGVTDIRAYLTLSLINVNSLENYLAAKHNFKAAKLSVDDIRDMVVLTVGNAYLTCLADAAKVDSEAAELSDSKVSLDQAVANHDAGTSPKLDLLRAQVDYQTTQQQQITADNQYQKDLLALARAIGLPLSQPFTLADKAPFAPFDNIDPDTAIAQALANRSDLKSLAEQVKAAQLQKKAAVAERLPNLSFSGDYGDIGTNPDKSHGTGTATGVAKMPIFEEDKLRGDAQTADSVLVEKQAQYNDARNQVDADVRDSLLDIQSAAKLVTAAASNKDMCAEALTEAQERFKAGVSDNLAVSDALAQLDQANTQYIAALYQHNVAKLSLARALGVAATQYKNYLGGE
jgi:outer membrane protein TolC